MIFFSIPIVPKVQMSYNFEIILNILLEIKIKFQNISIVIWDARKKKQETSLKSNICIHLPGSGMTVEDAPLDNEKIGPNCPRHRTFNVRACGQRAECAAAQVRERYLQRAHFTPTLTQENLWRFTDCTF